MVNEFDSEPLKSRIQKYFDVIGINIRGMNMVDFDEITSMSEKELARALNVRYIPAVIVLDYNNKPVARFDGYRSPKEVTKVLQFVSNKFYQNMSLTDYLLSQPKSKGIYQKRKNAILKSVTNLSTIDNKVAVVFDSIDCEACDRFYDHTLLDEEVRTEAKKFTWARLNADSTQTITTPGGQKITIDQWVKNLKLTYHPGVVLFDRGVEVLRIDAFLYLFHFKEALHYISSDAYKTMTRREFSRFHREKLLSEGVNIHVSH